MNKCKTTINEAQENPNYYTTLFKPMCTDFIFHFQMCSLILALNCTFRYNSLEEMSCLF